MRKLDLIIGALVSAGLHVGVLFGGELFKPGTTQHKENVDQEDILATINFAPPDEPPPPPPTNTTQQSQDSDAAEESSETSAASLPEPINTIAVSDITTVIKPTPPVPPKPGNELFSVPASQARKAVNTADIPNFVDFSLLDKKPVVKSQIAPIYPFDMQRQGVEGRVVLNFIVDDKGVVKDPYEVSATHREFVKPAIDAVLRWRFEPGKKNGKSVTTRMQIPIGFSIKDK